ncbi:MAG TPA: phosphonopyruvate decarboxylase [Burkholderiales bacterium]|nr:phosphonopyruvate decarboxylase [Burkholderiales bacterium]
MIESKTFVDAARARGFGLWTGVPCSYLTPFLNSVIADRSLAYVPASNEGEAVAIAVGSHIGGRRAVAMFQNSGLGNAVSPLTSLAHTHRVPVLLIVSRRGDPEGAADEPQHELMGRITTDMLDVIGVKWELFPTEATEVEAALERAAAHMDKAGLPYALVMRKGSVKSSPPPEIPAGKPLAQIQTSRPVEARTLKRDYLAALQSAATDRDIIVSTTGYTSRELYALGDKPNQLYVVGAMGCVSSVGLGLALARPDVRVTVLDGDGSALMRLGGLPAIAYQRPANLLHIVLDNGMHESTGGQFTVTSSVDLVAIAAACGYPKSTRVTTPEDLVGVFKGPRDALTFVAAAVAPGVPDDLPRPSVTPPQVTQRLREHLARLERS